MPETMASDQHDTGRVEGTKFVTPTHRFFKLNEASEPLKDTLKMLEIPLPAGVLGLRPLSEAQ
jgi:hypothetical protein